MRIAVSFIKTNFVCLTSR